MRFMVKTLPMKIASEEKLEEYMKRTIHPFNIVRTKNGLMLQVFDIGEKELNDLKIYLKNRLGFDLKI